MQSIDFYRAIQAAALVAPTEEQCNARAWIISVIQDETFNISHRAADYWRSVEYVDPIRRQALHIEEQEHAETMGELYELADRSMHTKHVTFKHASGRVKLVNTKERLESFASQVLKTWALWGGGPKPVETVKPRKARASTWRPALIKVAAESLEDGQAADFLQVAIDQLGGRAYMLNAGKPYILYAPDYAEGLPEGFAVARRDDGKWITTHMPSGLSIGFAFNSKAQALQSGKSALENSTPEKLARALEGARHVTENQHSEALEAWRAAHGLAPVKPETESHAEEPAALPAAADDETMSEEMAAIVAAAATVAIGTAQAQAAETCETGCADPRAYVAAAAVDLERLTNQFAYCATRRRQIEAGRRGDLASVPYIKDELQRIASQPGYAIDQIEARRALAQFVEAIAQNDRAQAADHADDSPELVTCDGPDLDTAAAADTPAASGDAIGDIDTLDSINGMDYTDPRETRAQAGDYTAPRETLRADYLRATETGHTQQAGSKSGAWSAVMFRTADGRAGLAFNRPGQPVELIDCDTGGERMRALQAMAQAAEQAHQQAGAARAPDYSQAVETMDDCEDLSKGATLAELEQVAQRWTPEQCRQQADRLEQLNDHGGALAWRCMAAGALDLAQRVTVINAAHDRAGHLTPTLASQRDAIAAQLRERLALDCTEAPETLAPDCTDPHKTQEAAAAPVFQRAKPEHVDLRHFIAAGLEPAQLVGLGVHYTGDMANAAGEGAIVEAQADDAHGVRVAVTLQDGRHMTHLNGYSFCDRPGSRFALNAKVHGAPYMAELAAARAALVASTEAAKTSKAQHHAAELVRLAEEFPHLERAESRHAGGKLAARNIRTMLKAAFPGQKFSVTSDYNSVRVRWVDGPTDAAVTAIIGRFDIGRADYNTDYFYTESSAWSELFGGVQYLFTERDESPELVACVLSAFNAKYCTQATAEDWRKQSGPFDYSQRDADAYRRWFREMLNETDATPAKKTRAA
jgi:hypothetical protein